MHNPHLFPTEPNSLKTLFRPHYIFVIALSLIVHQLYALFKRQFSAFISNTHKSFIRLISM